MLQLLPVPSSSLANYSLDDDDLLTTAASVLSSRMHCYLLYCSTKILFVDLKSYS